MNLDTVARFLWRWDCLFLLETSEGYFIWSDPEYPNGDNTIRPYEGTLGTFLRDAGVAVVRDKGSHRIKDYCGEDIIFID